MGKSETGLNLLEENTPVRPTPELTDRESRISWKDGQMVLTPHNLKSVALAVMATNRFRKSILCLKKPDNSALLSQDHSSTPESPKTVNTVQVDRKPSRSLSEQLRLDVEAIQRVVRERNMSGLWKSQ